MPSHDQFMSFPDRMDKKSYLGWNRPWVHARVLVHGAVRLHSNWVAGVMSDPQWRLYCNLDAGAEVYTEQGSLRLEAGRLYVLPAWLAWRGEIHQPLRHMFFGVDVPLFSRRQCRASWDRAYELKGAEEIIRDWQALCFTWLEGTQPEAADFCDWYQIVYRILSRFLSEYPPLAEPTPSELQSVCEYIDQHLGADLSNEALADVAFCSSGHLNRQFRKLINQTPASYVRERRLTAAAHRLAYTDDSIELIAEDLGFPNRHYLTRVFTKTMGYAPAAYRKLFIY